MKVYLGGACHYSAQVPRIAQGFRDLGHEVTPYSNDADLVYSNNDHAQIVRDKVAGALKPGAKVILTTLDLPLHIADFDFEAYRRQLVHADALCSISQYVQWQLRYFLDLGSHVIYQPIMGVAKDPAARIQPFHRFAHIGRRVDFNKRYSLASGALQILGYGPQEVALVGNEVGWGDYLGVQSEPNLNRVYNSVDFVLATSQVEGLCLPVLEAMACGAIPVVCRDMTTRAELLPPDLFPEYEEVQPLPASVAQFISRFTNDEYRANMAEFKDRLFAHYQNQWAGKLSGRAVAAAILRVYESIS